MLDNRVVKTILIYRWDSLSETMTINALKKSGFNVIELEEEIHDYHADAIFAQKMIQLLHSRKIDLVFSYDFFPIISMICEMNHIPYAAWIYDCPMYTLNSKTIANRCNYIFCFDQKYTEKLQKMGAEHVIHFPLASDLSLYETAVHDAKEKEIPEWKYQQDISFVGSLYNGKDNRFRQTEFSKNIADYIENLLEQQKNQHKEQIITKQITFSTVEELVQRCHLSLGEFYNYDPTDLAVDVLLMERTARDREEILQIVGNQFSGTVYTSSDLPDSLKACSALSCKGKIDYRKEMPLVFHNSKINLNISSRTIETAAPQRVFDILSCGGFCLTNYQKEIEELFVDGKELVMYTNQKDLEEKLEYYLSHEELRISIAKAGYEKIKKQFDINLRINNLIDYISQNEN